MDDKLLKKIYIEQTLKNRRYIGFRLDIALTKSIISIAAYILLYMYTEDLFFSLLIAVQIFSILTLTNKITIDKKIKNGNELLLQHIKREKFKQKIFYSDYSELENFIMLYLNQYRYKDIQRLHEYSYSAVKNEEAVYIYLMKFYEDACIEKIDIRNLLTVLIDGKKTKSTIIALNDLSEEANKLFDVYKDKLNIEMINFNDLYEFANNSSLLSEAYEYNDIEKLNKNIHKKNTDIISNIFINKKVIIYLISAVLFYITHKIILQNVLGLYISYYFIIIAIANILYNLYKSYTRKKVEYK